ncbi:MAG TPA: MFS transporter [Steroidobacteraceae bacterium]|jgi:MFS transporter, ACS family, glucarate transporter|nr:MFS transporter [Steroidobacteraceae bacterium]
MPSDADTAAGPPGRTTHGGWALARVRWRIFGFLFGFGLLAYVQQKSLTVAAERMMPELHLSQLEIGWLEQAFVVGYALFQLPAGVFGQRFGARFSFALFGLVAFSAVIATPLAPYWLTGTALFVVLLAAQGLLGISQAGIFPVSAGVFESWFPASQWSLVQGLQTMGLNLGATITPPLIVVLTARVGWQQALAWSSLPALALIALWIWHGRNTPREHPGVSLHELRELDDQAGSPPDADISVRRIVRLLSDRNTMTLALAYFAMNYTFYLLSNWCFLYLIQERRFSALEGGWLATAPPLAAAVGAGVGGVITSRLCRRHGVLWGFRAVPLLALPAAAVLLLMAVDATNPHWAVVLLAACFGAVELTEGAFWATAMTVGRGDTMAVGGLMNTGGNLGGIVGIPIVAYLSGEHAWHAAFLIGAVCAVASAAAWLAIDARKVSG